MVSLENGKLVQHASLGAGRIVAFDATAVHVFFATTDSKYATKLRLPMALSFLSPCAESAPPDERLSESPEFVLDAKSGRYGRAPAPKAPRAPRAKPRLRAVKTAAAKPPTEPVDA